MAVAEESPFHPVRDYLDGLEWDQTERLPTFFADFCEVPQSEFSAAFAHNFFVQAVARIYKPGCKAQLMLVLEGEQGRRKSTLAEVLAGPENYVDLGASPSDKDFYQIIQGKWLIEISEMASFARAETSMIKRAVSVAVDHFRQSYGRNAESFPRECVFFGTVNNSDWQRDETGARRYMPLWVGDINIDAITDMRDQLWAEAVAKFRDGQPWHVLPKEAKDQQESRYLEDVWAESIHHWLDGHGRFDQYATNMPAKIQTTTCSEILWRAVNVEQRRQDRASQTRVGNFMRRLGWERKRKRVGKTMIWQYIRPTEGGTDAF